MFVLLLSSPTRACRTLKEAGAFKLDVGGFDALDDVANDVDKTSKSWNRYAGVPQALWHMAD